MLYEVITHRDKLLQNGILYPEVGDLFGWGHHELAEFLRVKDYEKVKETINQLKAGWVTFVASIFRSIRFGATEAHGKANIMALNYLMDGKAVVYDAKTGTFLV